MSDTISQDYDQKCLNTVMFVLVPPAIFLDNFYPLLSSLQMDRHLSKKTMEMCVSSLVFRRCMNECPSVVSIC